MYDELGKQLREPCQYENCILCQQAADAIEELQAGEKKFLRNDRAVMMDSMREDGLLDTIRNNRELINAILNGEDGDDDGLCESDTEADSEG